MPANEKILMSVPDTCVRTGLSRTLLYEELTSGRLRSVKVGRRRLIPIHAIDEWVADLLNEDPRSAS